MLELSQVDAFYGNSRALQGVSLQIAEGEFLSVLGRNGVGKTTLMRSILWSHGPRYGSDGRSMAPTYRRCARISGRRPELLTCRRAAVSCRTSPCVRI